MATPGNAVQSPPSREWSLDDKFVAAFALLGFGSAVYLPLRFNIPPIVISFLLATGLAALTYRWLGGIPGTSFVIGTLKLGGALAALVGIALLINTHLVNQVQFRLITDDDIVGPWKWVYARGAASGHIYISKDDKGNLVFDGHQEKYLDENNKLPLYTLKNGKARLINRNGLTLEVDVEDHINKDHFHWKADAPLELLPAFRGSMRATRDDGTVITNTWGIMFYKQSGE
ncbi:MAG: hypothetical protein L0387_11110 [Acidobacteria bacterium]|nr:hypothetical protein [Acidobacteriota bacterium]